MLSKEKWRIVSHFLRHGRTIVAAGADVRFLVPVRRLVRASGHVDMAFDGRVLDGRIAFFTPDVFVAFAKPRARSFVNRVLRDIALSESTDPDVHVEGVSAADVDGAENLQVLRTHQMSLAGPAEQDLLFDTLVSVLHNTTLRARKQYVARQQLGLKPLPHQQLDQGRQPYASGLPRLPTFATRFGVVLIAPQLSVLLTNELMVINAGYRRGGRPCARCDWSPDNGTLALHCSGKLPECLDLSQCRCLRSGNANRGSRAVL